MRLINHRDATYQLLAARGGGCGEGGRVAQG